MVKDSNKNKFTKEEELLLQDFSRSVSKKGNIIFFLNAFIVSAIPICELILVYLNAVNSYSRDVIPIFLIAY